MHEKRLNIIHTHTRTHVHTSFGSKEGRKEGSWWQQTGKRTNWPSVYLPVCVSDLQANMQSIYGNYETRAKMAVPKENNAFFPLRIKSIITCCSYSGFANRASILVLPGKNRVLELTGWLLR